MEELISFATRPPSPSSVLLSGRYVARKKKTEPATS